MAASGVCFSMSIILIVFDVDVGFGVGSDGSACGITAEGGIW